MAESQFERATAQCNCADKCVPKCNLGTRRITRLSQPPYNCESLRYAGCAEPTAGPVSSTSVAELSTVDYLAPELADDFHQADIRADIYSLGCTFFFLLTSRAPFEGKTVMEVLDRHRWAPPRPVRTVRRDVPADLSEVIRKLMAKRPEERYQTPAEVEEVPFGIAGCDHSRAAVGDVGKCHGRADQPDDAARSDDRGPARRPRWSAAVNEHWRIALFDAVVGVEDRCMQDRSEPLTRRVGGIRCNECIDEDLIPLQDRVLLAKRGN